MRSTRSPSARTAASSRAGRSDRPGSATGRGGWSTCTDSELEVDAGEPGLVADGELLVAAEAVDLGERQLGVEPGVLDAALAHRAGGAGVDALGADREADRDLEPERRAARAVGVAAVHLRIAA